MINRESDVSLMSVNLTKPHALDARSLFLNLFLLCVLLDLQASVYDAGTNVTKLVTVIIKPDYLFKIKL